MDIPNSDSIVELTENDPLLKIENIVLALMTVKDTYKSISIIYKVTNKLYVLITAESNKYRRNAYRCSGFVIPNKMVLDFKSIKILKFKLQISSAFTTIENKEYFYRLYNEL